MGESVLLSVCECACLRWREAERGGERGREGGRQAGKEGRRDGGKVEGERRVCVQRECVETRASAHMSFVISSESGFRFGAWPRDRVGKRAQQNVCVCVCLSVCVRRPGLEIGLVRGRRRMARDSGLVTVTCAGLYAVSAAFFTALALTFATGLPPAFSVWCMIKTLSEMIYVCAYVH